MRVVKAVASLLGLLTVIIGVPVLLVRLVGWPGPDHVPGFAELRRQVMQRDFGTAFIIGALAVIGWVLWFQVVWATVWELAVNVRRVRVNIRPRRPPLVAAPIGRIVAGAVITIMSVIGNVHVPGVALASGPLQVSHTPVVTQLHAATPAAATQSANQSLTTTTSSVSSSTPDSTWVVRSGDTLWDIAEQTLGDGSRVDDIMRLNPQIRSAALISPGDVLTLPGDAVIPADRGVSADERDPMMHTDSVVVERGDTLWDLADEQLGDPTRWPEIAAANTAQISDPDLIQPGWTLNMPAPTVVTPAQTATPTPAATTADQPATVTADQPVSPAPADAADQAASAVPDQPATPVPAAAATPDQTAAATPDQPVSAGSDQTAASDQAGARGSTDRWAPPMVLDGATPGRSLPVGTLVGSAGIAALAIAMLERRRRRRGGDGEGSPATAAQVAAEMEVRSSAAHSHRPTVLLLQHMLVEMYEAQQLDPTSIPARFEVDDDGTCRIWWATPTNVVAPFTGDADCWVLDVDERPDRVWSDWEVPVFATLVSLGRTERGEVFVDLESIGAVAVVGDDADVDALMRGVVMQCGSPSVEVFADPGLAGDELLGWQLPAAADLDQLHLDRAGVWGSIDAGELATMVQARVEDYPAEQLRSAVVVTMHQVDPAMVCAARPGRGLAVLQRDVDDVDEVWMFDGDALMVQGVKITSPVAITPAAEQAIAELVHGNDVDVVGVGVEQGAAAEPERVATVTPLETSEPYTPLPFDLMIRVMRRDVDVVDVDGRQLDWVPNGVRKARRGGEVLLFLAFRGAEGASASQLIEALWYGRNPISPSTLTGVISGTRSIVGAERIETMPAGGWRLAPNSAVVTDVDVVAHAAAHVRGNPKDWVVLHDALALIGEQPLSDSESLNWASAYQFLARIDSVINDAITLSAKIAFDQDRLDDAAVAAEIGLRANPLNENVVQLAMRTAAAQGNIDRVRRLYQNLVRLLDDQLEEQPFPETTGLYNELVRGDRRAAMSESRAG